MHAYSWVGKKIHQYTDRRMCIFTCTCFRHTWRKSARHRCVCSPCLPFPFRPSLLLPHPLSAPTWAVSEISLLFYYRDLFMTLIIPPLQQISPFSYLYWYSSPSRFALVPLPKGSASEPRQSFQRSVRGNMQRESIRGRSTRVPKLTVFKYSYVHKFLWIISPVARSTINK